MAIPIDCDPNRNAEDVLDDDFTKFFQDLDEIIVDDELKSLKRSDSEESGFEFDNPDRLKLKFPALWDLPFDFFSNGDGYNDDEDENLKDVEFPDWFHMINFKLPNITDMGDPVPCPPSNPPEVSGSGSEKLALPKRSKTSSGSVTTNSIEEGGVVLALMAPQICPWRTSKGGIKKGRKPHTKSQH